jgi:DNA-binding MarR family transcriptional regulator
VSSTSHSPASAPAIDLLGRSDDVDRLRVVLLRLARRIRANSVGELTPSQFSLFVAVNKHGPTTVGSIADIEHVKPPTASKIIAALETAGLVERAADPDDRRCALIAPTELGRDYLEQVRAAGRTWVAGQLNGLDHDDVATLEQALPALERLLTGDR